MVNLWAGTISQATVTYFLTDGSVTDTTKQMVPWQVVSQRLETNITSSRDPAQTAYRGKVYKSQWIKFNNKYYCASSNGSTLCEWLEKNQLWWTEILFLFQKLCSTDQPENQTW